MKKTLFLLLHVLLFSACQESLEKKAERTLKDYTEKNCPIQMSATIMMDSCAFETDSHTLHYYYTLVGAMDNDSVIKANNLRGMLIEALKNETSTRVYKEAGYSFKYTYFSQKEKGRLLFETIMTKEDYQ